MYFKSRILIILLALIFITASTSIAGDIHFAVGGKYWLANWTYNYTNPSSGEEVTTDPVAGTMLGLSASLKYEKLGFNISILSGSGWKWEEDYDFYVSYVGYPVDDHYYGSYTDELKRLDAIFTASYSLIPQLSLFIGYKSTSYTEDYYDEWTRIIYDTNGDTIPSLSGVYYIDEEWDIKGSGMGAGVNLTLPITANKKLSVFGNLGYFKLGQDLDSGDTIIECGANYVIGRSMVLTGSYRYEGYENDIKIQGLSVGLSFFK